ncbi:hypothetical protein E2C01_001601 [Portunus trituberculatus]|uniref:Uncharacterized protein n=1 Tax=Portunus trituberculatus TaxID=210409 RepID=A0A5B7CH30_PORTR|nr:hypothetical protein [Portunus trituberculatus]
MEQQRASIKRQTVCVVCQCRAEAGGPACMVVVVASEVSAAPAALCVRVYVSGERVRLDTYILSPHI